MFVEQAQDIKIRWELPKHQLAAEINPKWWIQDGGIS